MSLFAVNNQKPPKPWKIISWFGSSSSGLGDKGGKAAPQRKESPAEPKDIKRAERLNERFTAFKKELGAYYRAYALKSVHGIQIKKYVPAQLGGVDSDKFRPVSNGQSVIDKMLQKRFGISLKQFEEKTITELRKIFGKAESTPAPKKAEKKSEPKKTESGVYPKSDSKDAKQVSFAFDKRHSKTPQEYIDNANNLLKTLKPEIQRISGKGQVTGEFFVKYKGEKFKITTLYDNKIRIMKYGVFRNKNGYYLTGRESFSILTHGNKLSFTEIKKKMLEELNAILNTKETKAEKKAPTPKPAPKKAETVPPIKKVEPAPAPVPKTEAPSEEEGIKQLDEIKALIQSAIQNKKAA